MQQLHPILKRLIDIAAALVGLIVLSPLLLVMALLIWIKRGSPIFFRQQRPGLHGKPFTLLKFRTMTDARDAYGDLFPDAERLTSFGQFLRRTSLDELPELFNVLCGDMSLVGPRPLLMQYLDLYTPEQARRHEVRPGITGWAQINGRNALSWEEKFELDVWYVDHLCLWLDLKILTLTVWKVLRKEGISQEGYATMPEFSGPETYTHRE
ncbi:sugar transferase [Aggregatilinea lenta]|uniref:sugar transferase n=1 Tax=Aggregatilinea lenta TaxID=913108 RepID=UPI000E5C0132|nr:sugar transferase [Aggregatilinea lenta]